MAAAAAAAGPGPGAAPASRAELKLVRLLSRCEALAADRRGPEEWRLEKPSPGFWSPFSKPAAEALSEYPRKVDFLKGLLEAEKLPSSSEKALANQFLIPGRTPTTAKECMPATKTVHLQAKARCTGEMRSALLDLGDANVRKRTDRLRTTVNVLGDSLGAGVIERLSRHELEIQDAERSNSVIEENEKPYHLIYPENDGRKHRSSETSM